MFTGIIETMGEVLLLERAGSNLNIVVSSSISTELKIDQSVSHNGVCLTVVDLGAGTHTVTAVDETLKKTNVGLLQKGDKLNLERCLQMNGRLDGHIVQGHVDQTGVCRSVENRNGSYLFTFEFETSKSGLLIEKGSVCVNGVSLTVVDAGKRFFSVAIIPYTFEHTNFSFLKPGTSVNLEFDVIGKYVAALLSQRF